MIWRPCTTCKDGKDWNPIEERLMTCTDCGGHAKLPVSGHQWFYAHGNRNIEPRIAVLQQNEDEPGKWIIDTYDQRGPRCKEIESADKIMWHLKGFNQSKMAPRLLDQWSRTQKWADSIDWMTWLQLTWCLHQHAGPQAVSDLWLIDDLKLRLQVAFDLKQKVAPHVSIW